MREAQLAPEGDLLGALVDLVVGAEVEADLAHADGAAGGEELARERLGRVVVLPRSVGMRPGDDSDVVEKLGHVPALELGRPETVRRRFLEAHARDGHMGVHEIEELGGAFPLARELVHGVHGHDEQAHAHERRTGEGEGGVMELEASQVAVGVGERGERRRHGAGAPARVVEELAVREGLAVEDLELGHGSFSLIEHQKYNDKKGQSLFIIKD